MCACLLNIGKQEGERGKGDVLSLTYGGSIPLCGHSIVRAPSPGIDQQQSTKTCWKGVS